MPLGLPLFGDGLPVIILELAPPFRAMLFAGRDRPEPVNRGTSQRYRQTWYPGAKEASVQVLGSREEPIVLRGSFSDPLTRSDGGPQARKGVLTGLVQGQATCRLFWGDTIVAYGRVASATFLTERQGRLRYEVVFDVDRSGDFVALTPLPIVAAAAVDVASEARRAVANLQQVADNAASGDTLGVYTPEEG